MTCPYYFSAAFALALATSAAAQSRRPTLAEVALQVEEKWRSVEIARTAGRPEATLMAEEIARWCVIVVGDVGEPAPYPQLERGSGHATQFGRVCAFCAMAAYASWSSTRAADWARRAQTADDRLFDRSVMSSEPDGRTLGATLDAERARADRVRVRDVRVHFDPDDGVPMFSAPEGWRSDPETSFMLDRASEDLRVAAVRSDPTNALVSLPVGVWRVGVGAQHAQVRIDRDRDSGRSQPVFVQRDSAGALKVVSHNDGIADEIPDRPGTAGSKPSVLMIEHAPPSTASTAERIALGVAAASGIAFVGLGIVDLGCGSSAANPENTAPDRDRYRRCGNTSRTGWHVSLAVGAIALAVAGVLALVESDTEYSRWEQTTHREFR